MLVNSMHCKKQSEYQTLKRNNVHVAQLDMLWKVKLKGITENPT